MKLFLPVLKFFLTLTLASAMFVVQARQVSAPEISDFLLEVSPPSGSAGQPGFFGVQVVEGAIVRYDVAAGLVSLASIDEVIANLAADPDRIFFDRFQVAGQDRSGLYNPLFCFDLGEITAPVSIAATDVNDHTIINLDADLAFDRAGNRLALQMPEDVVCFYRPYNLETDQYGDFGVFGSPPAPSGGLSVEYEVPASVVIGTTLDYERIISNNSGETLTVFFQEVFPANPGFFTSASFPSTELEVRGVTTVPNGQQFPSGAISRSVTPVNATPGEYLDLYFAVAALDGSGNLLTATEHRRVLVTAADATQSDFAATPTTNVVADGSDSATLTVTVRDPGGVPVEGQEVTLAITGGDAGGGGLTSGTLFSGLNGVAQASLTSTNAELIQVSAYLGSTVSGPLIGTVDVGFVAGPAAALGFSGSPAHLQSGSQTLLTLEVLDANGNLVGDDNGTSISFDQSGDGSVTGLVNVTSASGQASVTVTGNLAGQVTVTATALGLALGSTVFDVVPGAVAQLVFVSDASDLPSATQKSLTVELQDAQGNPIVNDPGLNVSFSKLAGTGDVDGLGSALSSGGTAVINVTGTTAGPVQIEASAAALASDTTSFDVVPGTATKLVFTSDETSVTIGEFKTLSIEIQDANNNRVTTDTRFIELSKVLGSGTGVVDPMNGLLSVTNGLATLPVEGTVAGSLELAAKTTSGDPNPLTIGTTTFLVIASTP